MDNTPAPAIVACTAAHERLLETVVGLADETAARPSLLPGWSVGHVLTHLARNADGHVRRLEGALRGEEAARYPGGTEQRDRDIEQGAPRSAVELATDVADSARRLEETWQRSVDAGWPHSELLASDHWPTTASPVRRLREVEVHHADLGLDYQASQWPAEYVDWELRTSLERLPGRLSGPEDTRRFLAWLVGRSDWPAEIRLRPWE